MYKVEKAGNFFCLETRLNELACDAWRLHSIVKDSGGDNWLVLEKGTGNTITVYSSPEMRAEDVAEAVKLSLEEGVSWGRLSDLGPIRFGAEATEDGLDDVRCSFEERSKLPVSVPIRFVDAPASPQRKRGRPKKGV